MPFNPAVDDTVSYIPRFQTFDLSLAANIAFDATNSSSLPLVLTPTLRDTTLLSSLTPLVCGDGASAALGNGAPALNHNHTYYFSGRSDNFDPAQLSTDPRDARWDAESIRVAKDGWSVYICDEYGPFVYQIDRPTGHRVRSFRLP